MSDQEPETPAQVIRIILDATAIGEYGRSEHVGEVIKTMDTELALHLSAGTDDDTDDLPGVPAFGVPALALATALGAAGKDRHDLILAMLAHPWCVVLPVTADQVRRNGFAGWEQPMTDWTAELGNPETAHNVVCAIDHECLILTADPDAYTVDDELLEGLLVRIPGEDDDWPDQRDYWPTSQT